MNEKQKITLDGVEFKLTEEQLKKIKRWKLLFIPFRLFLALTFFSFIVGGPEKLFGSIPGLTFAILFSLQVIIEKFVQAPDAGGRREDQGSVVIAWIAFGSTFFLALLDWNWIRPHWSLVEWNYGWLIAGILLFVCGQTLRVISIRTLGRFFTITVRLHEGHQVVQNGIYAYIRHPSYTALMMVILGHVTLFASPLGYAAFVLFAIPGISYRIRVEEKALLNQFGEEYKVYSQKTKRLIPFII
jgi:protein-S-isoprenylcysteine O-methyltransferase Ste14